ncbi:MAG TPA: UDP-N-acetylglucosamine--N-acetylmuramyl-(pentapeptide) pyrophosphoryl-undecaprenol N-acetylglucosamine transferase [Candidatus Binatia bacterium]|nr:UDP-N-acetylglucosamine--N-acetylmuramyl-(pentapeptide) pyrophosphoryl-undecaprenol N-acetylglucosamine transferase [Candidatus Binatia bacterium]
MRVAFAGGGTGGHIYPALAIDEALRADAEKKGEPYEARFFGNPRGLEAEVVPAHMPLTLVPSRPLSRKLELQLALTVLDNARGIALAGAALVAFKPDVVVATGGYVCFPVAVAARLLRVTRTIDPAIAMLEINAVPGLTNRLLAPLVDEVWGAFAQSHATFGRKFILTGTPTRASLRTHLAPETARVMLGLNPAKTTVVVMGGSQGARSINEATTGLVTRRSLPDTWQVLHICGRRDYEYMKAEHRALPAGNHVRLLDYLEDPAPAYAAADLVVARSGASTLAELAVTATPSLLVPYPRAAEEHQLRNADEFSRSGAAAVLEDRELSADALWWRLVEMLEPQRLASMRRAARELGPPDATAAIVRRVAALASLRVKSEQLAKDHAT